MGNNDIVLKVLLNGVEVEARKIVRTNLRLGDKVVSVAQPIARTLDKVLGTNIANCGGCKKRKDWLNTLSAPSVLARPDKQ